MMVEKIDIIPKIIGVTGFARSGKDTFVKVASKILQKNGFQTIKLAFADDLKNDIDDWLKEKYGISAWTDVLDEKNLIRPFLVAHGCAKRIQTDGKYWIDKIHNDIIDNQKLYPDGNSKLVFFISDVRFPNEAKWIHEQWNGWIVHLKKYTKNYVCDGGVKEPERILTSWKSYDVAPNEEEAKNDPELYKLADFKLELENVIEREKRKGNIITVDQLVNCEYLQEKITKCLMNCPFLTIQTP
jgi:hypothetical protein